MHLFARIPCCPTSVNILYKTTRVHCHHCSIPVVVKCRQFPNSLNNCCNVSWSTIYSSSGLKYGARGMMKFSPYIYIYIKGGGSHFCGYTGGLLLLLLSPNKVTKHNSSVYTHTISVMRFSEEETVASTSPQETSPLEVTQYSAASHLFPSRANPGIVDVCVGEGGSNGDVSCK